VNLEWRKADHVWTDAELRNRLMLATAAGRLRAKVAYRDLKDGRNHWMYSTDSVSQVEKWVDKACARPGRYEISVTDGSRLLMQCVFEVAPLPPRVREWLWPKLALCKSCGKVGLVERWNST
jgi:hypothetical protein